MVRWVARAGVERDAARVGTGRVRRFGVCVVRRRVAFVCGGLKCFERESEQAGEERRSVSVYNNVLVD